MAEVFEKVAQVVADHVCRKIDFGVEAGREFSPTRSMLGSTEKGRLPWLLMKCSASGKALNFFGSATCKMSSTRR